MDIVSILFFSFCMSGGTSLISRRLLTMLCGNEEVKDVSMRVSRQRDHVYSLFFRLLFLLVWR